MGKSEWELADAMLAHPYELTIFVATGVGIGHLVGLFALLRELRRDVRERTTTSRGATAARCAARRHPRCVRVLEVEVAQTPSAP